MREMLTSPPVAVALALESGSRWSGPCCCTDNTNYNTKKWAKYITNSILEQDKST